MKLKLNNPFKNKIKYLNDEGRPRSLVRTGGSKSSSFSSKERSLSNLKTYWTYYSGDGTIFAAVNTTAWNTVMVGYHLISDDDEAKKEVQKFLDRIDFEKVSRQATLNTLIFGDGFIEKVYTKKEDVSRLKSIDPRTMIINSDEYGDITSYQQELSGRKQPEIDPQYIIHLRFFEIPGSPYGLSLIAPNKDTIDRKVSTDEALFNAIKRHGTLKWVASVGSEKDGQIPPDSVMDDIKEKLEDIESKNEFVVPWFIDLKTIDEQGIEGVEEYFNYFQTQLVIGLLCPEEALGLGKGSTEACYDEKTEVLTKRGWINHLDLTDNDIVATFNPDTQHIEYHKPLESVDTHIYEHDGDMIRFKSQKLDMMVTPNHRMWVNKNPTLTKEDWKFVTAEEIYNSNSQWAIKYKIDPEYIDLDNEKLDGETCDLYELIGYFVSEGSLNKDKSVLRLSQKKPESVLRIKRLIASLSYKYKFTEQYNKEKGYTWTSYDKELKEIFSEFGDNCYNKFIPRKYIDTLPEYLEILLKSAIDGDGTVDKRQGRNCMEYSTTSKKLADNIQEIALKCGYRTNLIFSEDKRDNRVGMWRVSIDTNKKDYVIITPKMCEKVYYKNKVACLNVPNHIYLTRRNNKIAIQGNTARIKAIMYERMIKSFQHELENIVRMELINPFLEKNGFKDVNVYLKFNQVTEEDEALKAKWLGGLLRGFRNSEMPFTRNEIRSFFGLQPREDMEDVPKGEPHDDRIKPKPEEENIEEEPEVEEEDNEEDEENE